MINDLKPNRFYKFYIRSRYVRPGNSFTSWTSVRNKTHESRPSKEVQFESIENQRNDILLKWDVVPKESQNGKMLGYKIYVNNESYAKVDVNYTQYLLKGIGYESWYNICITAFNSAGESPFNCQSVELIYTPTPTYEDSQPNLEVRLVGGGNNNEGRVEVTVNGRSGTVCDDGWDINDAHVVCKALGLGRAREAVSNARFGQGSGDILLDDVSCRGTESSLNDCVNNGIGVHNCDHSQDAGVICVQPSQKHFWNTLKDSAVLIIIGIVMVTVVTLYCGYSKLKNFKVFTKWPEPKFTKINFNEVNFPVRESEVFDELRARQTTITISQRGCSADCRILQNHPYLGTENTTENSVHFLEDKDGLLDGTVVYNTAREKKLNVQSVQNENLRSESNVNCIGKVMYIDSSVSSNITRDKNAVLIKNNGHFLMPQGQYSDQKVITPCSDLSTVCPDRQYIAPCLDHEGIVPLADNLPKILDTKDTVPSLEHSNIAPNFDSAYVALSSNHIGLNSPLKQDLPVALGKVCDPLFSCSN
ncbi:uncharacterized protein LOC117112473 isoform X2 [Anneissia japonica]|uniref:uncharacterized protein LOC117112473 isoform X2 n=1 Tax=Anneissia japonica TaxID=1529436 RepID=UPI001425AC66|nr:uncharacterized protein LOC117112473 isoform X2 [Anneissia japonica]